MPTQDVSGTVRDDRPMVYFMPSAEGDDDAFVRFRRELNDEVLFTVIEYPAWHDMIGKGAGFDVIIDAAVEQILAGPARDSYFLSGYSFGGFVAWEVARRLRLLNKPVGFVGLIDARRHTAVRQPENREQWFRRKLSDIRTRPREAFAAIRWQLVYPLVLKRCPKPLLQLFGDLASSNPFTPAFGRRLLVRTRMLSTNQWTAQPLEVPAYLFRSDEFSADAPDFNWGVLCGQLSVIPVRGDHLTLFDPKNLGSLCRAFAEAVRTASNRVRAGGVEQ